MDHRQFEVETAVDGRRLTLAVKGELDLATVDRFKEALATAARSGSDEVCVDLSEVRFMDSTGLAALVGGHRALDDRLVVICPDGPARLALDVSGLNERLHVRRSSTEAI